jgi:UDP-N-acetylmuramate--alanine ligase
MPDLVPYRRVHVIGAGGSGMSGLAKLLVQCGHQVTGSDLKPGMMLSALEGAGADTWIGHRPDMTVKADLVVVSSAVPPHDPEVTAAREAGIEVWERPQLLAAITERLGTIGITGTHGKTTGTAMAVTALRALGRDPSFMVGGRLIDLNTNSHLGEEDLFVLEADEAFGTFLSLELDGLLITNIEADHLDYYGSVESMEDAFAEVADRVDGPVVACFDDAGVQRLAARHDSLIGYGFDERVRWRMSGIEHRDGGVAFSLLGSSQVDVWVPKPGHHIARNAAGVIALLAEFGFDPGEVAEGLKGFTGVRRRFEVRSRRGGVILVDDYAHHPTEVAATLKAARLGHRGRIVAVFQPHRFTRTEELGLALGEALSLADQIFISDVYAAGEAPIPGVSGNSVLAGISDPTKATYVPRRADLAEAVAAEVEAGDLVLLLGAGDVTQVADELTPLLPT